MGNLKHLPEGADFQASDFSGSGFPFTGSAQGYDEHGSAAPPFAGSKPTDNGPNLKAFAKGGSTGGHPHGHKVVRVENKPDGTVVMHHAHGGFSVCHADGGMTHHGHDGQSVMKARGGQVHDTSEYAHRARGGAMGSDGDNAENESGFGGHKDHPSWTRPGFVDTVPSKGRSDDATQSRRYEHETGAEEKSDDPGNANGEPQYRRGGNVALPRGMRPKVGHAHAIGNEVAMNRPPRSPKRSPTTRNKMPGDEMAYGVEPGSEPDVPPGGNGRTPMLRRGGRA